MGQVRRILKKSITYWLVVTLATAVVAGEREDIAAADAASGRGDYADAVARLSASMDTAGAVGRVPLLIRRGEAYRGLGRYAEAQSDFAAARQEADELGSRPLTALSACALARVRLLQGFAGEAESLFQTVLAQLTTLDLPELTAACTAGLAQAQQVLGRVDEAVGTYRQALTYARKTGDRGQMGAIACNLASLQADAAQARGWLLQARSDSAALEPGAEKTQLYLCIAAAAEDIQAQADAGSLASEVLNDALTTAESVGDARSKSLALGMLGAQAAARQDPAKARLLTERAILAARPLQDQDLLIRWELRLGRLMRQLDLREDALGAFRRASEHAESIRSDLALEDATGRSWFVLYLRPIYVGLADLLLQQVAPGEEGEREQALLREAQQAVERLKLSEIRDYLKDACIGALSEQVASLAPDTAVIYPIALPDRLEVLVDVGGTLYRSVTDVTAAELEHVVSNLARALRYGLSMELESEQVYRWLVAPVEPLLEQHGTKTLVIVPDGVLRMVPLATLYDGERYLVERFALATTPGLTLVDARPLTRSPGRVLLAGLSRPGPAVDKLPHIQWREFLAAAPARGALLQWRGADIGVVDYGPAGEVELPRGSRADLIERLTLPGVAAEIKGLTALLPATVQLDQDFLRDAFEREVSEHDYRIVHIASHGYFGGTPQQSFVLTYDEKLTVDDLSGLLQPKRISAAPVELLALSACHTAEGDDRTPLGLSGIALKSGARSVLGSLWPVNDEAARRLVERFYEELRKSGRSKAAALARAQNALRQDPDFSHPVFWAPFVIVGNWL